MSKKRSTGNTRGQHQKLPRRPQGSSDAPGSTHGRARAAFDPVRDRIDSDWAPGMPADLGVLPTTLYHSLAGRVYTLVTWPDESTARGEVPIQQLRDILGGRPLLEGWYSIAGEYLGEQPPGSIA